jgi:hypothetical protein
MATVTVPSLAMRTKAEGCSNGLRPVGAADAAVCAPASSGKAPRAKPEATPILRKLRRSKPSFAIDLKAPCASSTRANSPFGNWFATSKVAESKCMVISLC